MRGLERDLVIIDRKDYTENKRYIKFPDIVSVISYGNGWLDIQMSDGFAYRRSGGTLSWRYNNPGNIKYGNFARSHKAVGRGWAKHAVFPSYNVGRWAKKQLLFTPVRKYYNYSLRDAIALYAPRSDRNARNRPDIYARFILNRTPGVTLNTRLRNFNEDQQNRMLMAMEQFEGFKPGRIDRI